VNNASCVLSVTFNFRAGNCRRMKTQSVLSVKVVCSSWVHGWLKFSAKIWLILLCRAILFSRTCTETPLLCSWKFENFLKKPLQMPSRTCARWALKLNIDYSSEKWPHCLRRLPSSMQGGVLFANKNLDLAGCQHDKSIFRFSHSQITAFCVFPIRNIHMPRECIFELHG